MFGFFKKKPAPEGPVQFTLEMEIGKPPADVYALVDWADPRNAKRALGHQVSKIGPDVFHLVMDGMDDLLLEFTVTQAVPHSSYGFDCMIEPAIGNLLNSHELYQFEPLGEDGCRVVLVTTATFVDGLSLDEFERELAMMTLACHNALAKFKIHAEHGANAVKLADGQMIVDEEFGKVA